MSFTKFHLAISKDEFSRSKAAGKFGLSDSADLSLKPVKPDYEMFYLLTRIVGEPYGWHRRQEYHDEKSYDDLVQMVQDPKSRLWLFKWRHETVGFCCAAVVEPNLSDLFQQHAGPGPAPEKIAEIYKIGLFDEYTGHGWGRMFLQKVMAQLFEEHDAVYLNTRSTNHGQVVPFYTGVGMRIVHQEELEDDLLAPDLGAPKIDMAHA